ncbi:GNAT family N-acetyltransferase [Bacillus salitolerans]|uniref:GNAT family N-acetyltransferase n=1 Tax=Bacillus salitolerans TaxID=1437434 RepID=A0ABW4LU07_9BACI
MIRSYQDDDFKQVTQLINRARSYYKMLVSNEIKENSVEFIVYVEQEVILGIAYATSLINDAKESEAQIKVFVDNPYRLRGIGKSFVRYLEKELSKRNADIITSCIRVDLENTSKFCHKVGFEKWWGSPELFYVGTGFSEVMENFVRYEDKYFDSYLKVVQESFYDVHVINDIKPYLVTEEIVKRYKLNYKENVYLLLKEDEILASVTIGRGTVENLMVSKIAQGKGYGKKALQFAINMLLSQGYKEIRICYMEGNDSAENLYLSLGFKPLHNTHVYRKIIRNR